jgi:hypothetical protein
MNRQTMMLATIAALAAAGCAAPDEPGSSAGDPVTSTQVSAVVAIDGLPQGLTGGLTYDNGGFALAGFVLGSPTLLSASPPVIGGHPGWLVRVDSDRGEPSNLGFYHQELVYGGSGRGVVMDVKVSEFFALPPGTACGFHHTLLSPPQWDPTGDNVAGTCMGQDPGGALSATGSGCPVGWQPRRVFDMGSGDGRVDCDSQEGFGTVACGYWVWCEYQDPNQLCPAGSACAQSALNSGFTCGISADQGTINANDLHDRSNHPLSPQPDLGRCLGVPTGQSCPAGTVRSSFFDNGRGSGHGLGDCHT